MKTGLSLLGSSASWFERRMGKTVIGTLLWSFFTGGYSGNPGCEFTQTTEFLWENLNGIKEVCNENKVPLILAGIPDYAEITGRTSHKADSLTGIVFPQGFGIPDYIGRHNQHFNSIGHKKYALFLKGLIDSRLRDSQN